MTLQLTLPHQLQERLRLEAARRGESDDTVTLELLDKHLPPATVARQTLALALLKRWGEEDVALTSDELAANARVLKAIDENRPACRRLFSFSHDTLD
jgi:hypothetical protein